MLLTCKPKSIQVIGFDRYNYGLPTAFAEELNRLYDANGNLVYDSQDDIYREYNELNQLSRTRQNNSTGTILQEYVWDPLEEKIFIKDEFYTNGSLKSSTYYFGQDYIIIQNSSGTYNRTNIYQDGILVGYEDFDGKKKYVLPDHKGSAHIILNESGGAIEENLFSPFAEPLAGVKENKFSYEAKEYDPLTKDYDFHFRKFSVNGPPILNQPDTLIQNVYDPQQLNRYSFERNNPLKNIDPTGHCIEDACIVEGFLLYLAISTALGKIADVAYQEYKETVPEYQRDPSLERFYKFITFGGISSTSGNLGKIIESGGKKSSFLFESIGKRFDILTITFIVAIGISTTDYNRKTLELYKQNNYNLISDVLKNSLSNSRKYNINDPYRLDTLS